MLADDRISNKQFAMIEQRLPFAIPEIRAVRAIRYRGNVKPISIGDAIFNICALQKNLVRSAVTIAC
jgi:hypothetical protein